MIPLPQGEQKGRKTSWRDGLGGLLTKDTISEASTQFAVGRSNRVERENLTETSFLHEGFQSSTERAEQIKKGGHGRDAKIKHKQQGTAKKRVPLGGMELFHNKNEGERNTVTRRRAGESSSLVGKQRTGS